MCKCAPGLSHGPQNAKSPKNPRTRLLASLLCVVVCAVGATAERARVTWDEVLKQPPAWYAGEEARRVADNVIAYQRATGGWPKDIDMAAPLDREGAARLAAAKSSTDSTIDNGATTTQLRFLARVRAAGKRDDMAPAMTAGIEYLLRAQYENGGWPQFYPLRPDYSRYITFNDDAMINVMTLLRDVARGEPPFAFVDPATRARAARAVDRGLAVILAAQIRVDGARTVWCAQHDERTLEPRGARTYEHPSLSGRESVGILAFLMEIAHPSADVSQAIEGGVAWFERSRLDGVRLDQHSDPALSRGFDVVLVPDPAAPPLWARFYEIGTNRPIFSGRDGMIKYALSEIEYERRTGYSWIGPYAATLLSKTYPGWKKARG